MEATLNEITRVVDEQIRPRLQAHGGDLSIISFEEGILRIKLHGACSTCPSAQLTMEETVKAALEGLVEDVFVVTTINDDLLNYAKTILNTHKP